MFCINCFNGTTQVSNSRPHKKDPTVWRRRNCPKCHRAFSTIERPSLTDNRQVLTADGSSATFNLGKLIVSIAGCFSHDTDKGTANALWLAQTVETTLATDYPSVTTDDIAVITHQVLKRYDELAAVQYAAKYSLITSLRRRGRPSISPAERGSRTDESLSR